MQHRDRRRHEMLTRVRSFGETHRHLFPADSEVHDAFTAVGAAIEALNELGVTAWTAARAARVDTKAVARRALVRTLLRAMQTADVMEEQPVAQRWAIRSPLKDDDVQLLTTARYFRECATPAAVRFAAHGMPLEELDRRIADFEHATNQHYSGRIGTVGTRAAMDQAFKRAMRAVAAIDVSVANYFASGSDIQAAWQHARRLGYKHRKPGRAKNTTALAARQPVGVVQAASRMSAMFEFLLSKFRAKRQLPPPDVEVDVIEPPRKTTRLLGP